MINWILIYSIHISIQPMNKPVIMDNFTSKEQCEIALNYIDTAYRQMEIKGTGYCWGERN